MGFARELESYSYSITNLIASQPTSTLVATVNTKTNESVAIKILDLSKSNQRYFMIIEVDVMSRLKHPHIMGLTNIISKYNGALTHYIGLVMPLANCTLEQFNLKAASTQQCLSLFYKLATGLAYLHSQHVLHLDIKHSNVVIKDNEPYWIDFGSSSFTENIAQGIQHESQLVSLLYRAPEIYNVDRWYTGGTDVWSFGILMLLMLSNNETWYDALKWQLSYSWLVNKFKTNDYLVGEVAKISTFSDSNKLLLVDVLTSMLRVAPKERATMEQICNHAIFDTVRIPISGSLATITYSQSFHSQHYMVMHRFVKWTVDNYSTRTDSIFLTIDLYYRVAAMYRTNTDMTFEVLVILFTMACKFFEESEPDSFLLDKLWFVTSDKIELELQLLHQLNGVIYHSPYYEAANNSNELQIVLRDVVLKHDPTVYTKLDISKWFKELRNPTITDKLPQKDVENVMMAQ